MIGSFLTRALVMVFGYAYPAYECYKTVEQNKPDIEQLIFWCQYWILVAFLTVCERIGDAFISWLPMYSEGKLAFFIYLWYSKTRGTAFIYDSFFKPYVAKHETEIDRNLLELRTRAGDIAVVYWQKAASYGQTRIFDILQYIAAQSTPRPRPTQPQRHGSGVRQTSSAANRQPAATTQPQGQEPSSPTSSSSSSQNQEEVAEEEGHSEVPEPALPEAVLSTPKLIANPPAAETSTIAASSEAEAMQIESVSSLENQNANPPLKETKETIIEETIRITRARLKKNRPR